MRLNLRTISLDLIFYRYLSERTEDYMNDLLKDDGITYREALAR